MVIPPKCGDSGASECGRAIHGHLVSAGPLHEPLPEALLAEHNIDHDRVGQLWGILDASNDVDTESVESSRPI